MNIFWLEESISIKILVSSAGVSSALVRKKRKFCVLVDLTPGSGLNLKLKTRKYFICM